MKNLLLLACATAACVATARTYYVDTAGDDAASGTSPETAWRSPARVAKETFKPGDKVLFKSGCMWRFDERLNFRGAGTAEAPILVSRYGEGPQPEFRGSVDGTVPGFWTALSNGVWTSTLAGKTAQGEQDVGNIVCVKKGESPDKATCGWKRWKLDDLTNEGDYYHDLKCGIVYFKSARDPAAVYSRMELCRKVLLLNLDAAKWVRVEDLAFMYTGSHGINGAPVEHLRVRGCTFGWIGGSLLGMWPDGQGGKKPVRYGNGIEFWTSPLSRDIRLENNFFYEVYDTAMTNQGNLPGVLEGMVICSNRTVRCEQSYEVWFSHTNYHVKSIEVFGNRFEDAGYGWSHAQRPDKNATHFLAYGFACRADNILYHDNHLGRTKQSMFWWFCWPAVNHIKLDRNTYVQPGVDVTSWRGLFHWRGEKADCQPPWDVYRRITGNDAHSRLLTPPEPDPAVRAELAANARRWLALPNGDFEVTSPGRPGAFSGWTVTDRRKGPNCRAVADDAVTHGGKYALRIDSVANERIQVARNVNLRDRVFVPGRVYRLSAALRHAAGPRTWSCDFGVYTDGLKCLYGHGFAPQGDDWTCLSDTFTLPAGGAIIRIMCNVSNGASGWIDDLCLEERLEDGTWREVMTAGY